MRERVCELLTGNREAPAESTQSAQRMEEPAHVEEPAEHEEAPPDQATQVEEVPPETEVQPAGGLWSSPKAFSPCASHGASLPA
jgi:hypothetical protein